MDVPNYSTDSGVQLWQWTCGASSNQTWTLTPSTVADRYLIKSNLNGLCVSNKDSSTAGNNPISQEPCSDIARMQWRFTPTNGTPTPTPTSTVPYSNTPDGFASTSGMGDGTTTGGAAGSTVTVTTYADLVKYAGASEPYVIKVNGAITVSPYGTEIKVASNKTIIGVGTKPARARAGRRASGRGA
ncbi:RICIN domain-containing protein [Microbispora sp. CA-102843]|uniref:RICIN domain-containing protein n=1 Tax=Microbispora sp. CA-102843 TaxID=3239952 RepID=UPI003D934670